MESTAQLLWAMLFGAIGIGLFTYGKRQKAFVPLLSGIALFLFPYFMPNVYLLVFTGTAITALPFLIKV